MALLFLFSKHLDIMANVTDCDYGKTNFCNKVLKIVLKAFQKQNNNSSPMMKLNILIQRGVKVLVEEPCPSPILKKNSNVINHDYRHDEIRHC